MIKKLAFTALLLIVSNSAFAQETLALQDFDEALLQAASQQKRLAVYFYAEGWNAPKSLDSVLPDHRVIHHYLSREFLILNVDAASDWGRPIAEKYNVLGVQPSLALVRNDGVFLGYLSLLDAETEDYLSFFLESSMILAWSEDERE